MSHQRLVAAGYETVAEIFDSIHGPGAIGASFAVMHAGKQVLDLWGGNTPDGGPWTSETKCIVASGTKGIVAVAVLICAERGLLDLGAPIESVWPEFAVGGKGRVSIGDALAHVAGVPGLQQEVEPGEFFDLTAMARRVAAQTPIVEVGSPSYHAATYGWIAAELIRRSDGREIGDFVRDEIAGPLGLDLHIGASEAVLREVVPTTRSKDFNYTALLDPNADPRLRYVYGIMPQQFVGTLEMARHQFPGGGGVATARAMARLYAVLVNGGELDGVRILRPETITSALHQRSFGNDPLSGRLLRFGVGFELNPNPSCLGAPDNAFGHTGAGGSTHGAWPTQKVGFSYVMGEFRPETNDGRARRMLDELYRLMS